MSKVLVTGATGNIGRKLVSLLMQQSLPRQPGPGNPTLTVVPCFRKPDDASAFIALGASPVFLDMNEPASVRHAMRGIDTLFLLKPYTIRMLIQSKIVLDAARAAGVGHVIHVGAFGADDTPWATIGWNHLVERYIEALGFHWTHLRPNFFMDNLFRAVRPTEGVLAHFMQELPVSWISCQDIAAVAAAVIAQPEIHHRRTYSLAVESCSLPHMAKLLSELTGRRYRYVRLTPEAGFEMMTRIGREPEFVQPWLQYMTAVAEGQVEGVDSVFNNVQALTGSRPQSLRDFIGTHLGRFT